MNTFELWAEYHKLEFKLAKIADSFSMTRKEMTANPYALDYDSRCAILGILRPQLEILIAIRDFQKKEIVSEDIVDLSAYRNIMKKHSDVS